MCIKLHYGFDSLSDGAYRYRKCGLVAYNEIVSVLSISLINWFRMVLEGLMPMSHSAWRGLVRLCFVNLDMCLVPLSFPVSSLRYA